MYKSYRDFIVWQRAHELVKDLYLTEFKFSSDERYGLYSQIKRSTVSIAANIAEGCGRQTSKEFVQFLFIAKGSANETNYYLLLCYELNFISKEDYLKLDDKCQQVIKMLSKLISKIKNV